MYTRLSPAIDTQDIHLSVTVMAPVAVTPPNDGETVTDLTSSGIQHALEKSAPSQLKSASLTNTITATPPPEHEVEILESPLAELDASKVTCTYTDAPRAVPALGSAEMAAGRDRGPPVEEPLEGGDGRADAQVIRDDPGPVRPGGQGDVEVAADEDPPARRVGQVLEERELHAPTMTARSTRRLE